MIGRTLAHYTITGLLGSGGMGEVYRARDTKLERDVALKVLPAEMAMDAVRLSRFVREAKLVAGLNHPNIVTMHSVDEADDVHFLTMELVEGETLAGLHSPDGLPLDRIIELAAPIADALAAAHAQGIVHRDLKPGNVMITRDGGRVKVLDFGLAKLNQTIDEDGSAHLDTLTVTKAGVLLGTPCYMSPEQARGAEVDARSDIFALGVMLYEMATGEQPFKGSSTIELLSSVLRDQPRPVSQLRPGLPVQLGHMIDRCLAKNPADRYDSARQLHADLVALKSASAGGDLTGRFIGIPEQAIRPWWGRKPVALTVGTGAVLAILAWVWFAVLRPSAESPVSAGHVVAVLPFENLGHTDDEYFAAGMTDEITSRLTQLEGLAVISRTSASIYAGTDKSIREIGKELGTDFILEGTIRWDGATDRIRISPRLIRVANDTQVWADRYDREVTEIYTLQAEIASRIAEALDVSIKGEGQRALEVRPTEDIDAYRAYLQGMKQLNAPGFGRESFGLGIQMLERATSLDENFALAFARLSSMNSRMYHYGFDRSHERLARAKEAADRALALQPDLAEAHLALGHYYYWGVKDYNLALAALERAHALAPSMGEVLLANAYVKRRQGDFESALAFLERYRFLSPMDPNAYVGLGETYGTLRRYAEAERAFERAVSLQPDDAYSYTELGLLYLRWRGDAARARAILARAPHVENTEPCRVGYLAELLDRDYGAALVRLDNCSDAVLEAGAFYEPVELVRGIVLRLSNEPERAREAFTAALGLLSAKLQEGSADHRIHAALGLAYAGLGRSEEAVRHGTRAVQLYPLDKDALEAPVLLINLALVHTMVGQGEAALANLDTALSIPSILSTAWLRKDPRWDELRDAEGFEALLRKHEIAASR
jgi:serine/threonine protein kinase/tetratricopeptide (TPR) repeat protein